VRAVVLVGGKGTRLRPLTLETPKQMLPVGGRPMIERVLEHLAGHGIAEVVLSLGYRPDAFLEAYPDGTCAGVALRYAVEDTPLDTAGAIGFAARHAGVAETFVVVNGDVITGLDVGALIDFHRRSGAEATIALTPVEDPSAFGVVPTDPTGRVLAFIEKPDRDTAPTNLINAGTYVLEPSVLDRIPSGRRVSIERETFPQLVSDGRLYAMASSESWLDAGTAPTYLAANLAYAQASHTGAGVHPDARVTDSVLGAGVTVAGGATVERAVLLDGVVVGAGAQVRDSIVGAGATVGSGCVVDAGTLVGPGVRLEDGVRASGARIPDTDP